MKVQTKDNQTTTKTSERFYGYKHWTLEDPPRCFNVGKGVKKRPWNKRRNHKWHAISKRLGLRVEVCIGPVINQEACAWEIEQIAAMGTFSTNHSHTDDADIGCNFTKGGEGNLGRSDPWSSKARENHLAANAVNKGKPAHNRGVPCKPEVKAHLSALNKGENHPMYGKSAWNHGKKTGPRPESVRLKISLAKKGRPAHNKGQKRS